MRRFSRPAITAISTDARGRPGRAPREQRDRDEARRPARVDGRRVPRPALQQVERAEQEAAAPQPMQPQLPAMVDHAASTALLELLGERLRAAATLGFAGSTWIGSPTVDVHAACGAAAARARHAHRHERRAGDEREARGAAVPAALAMLLRRSLREDPEHAPPRSSSSAPR